MRVIAVGGRHVEHEPRLDPRERDQVGRHRHDAADARGGALEARHRGVALLRHQRQLAAVRPRSASASRPPSARPAGRTCGRGERDVLRRADGIQPQPVPQSRRQLARRGLVACRGAHRSRVSVPVDSRHRPALRVIIAPCSMPSLPSPADAVGAAGNLFDATVRGGLADTRRMPSALIDEGPLRRVHRYLPLGRGGRRRASLPVLLVPPLAAPALLLRPAPRLLAGRAPARRGHETYLVDYGPVRFGDRTLGLEHWIEDVIPNAVRAVVGGRRRPAGAARRLVPRRDPGAARPVRGRASCRSRRPRWSPARSTSRACRSWRRCGRWRPSPRASS